MGRPVPRSAWGTASRDSTKTRKARGAGCPSGEWAPPGRRSCRPWSPPRGPHGPACRGCLPSRAFHDQFPVRVTSYQPRWGGSWRWRVDHPLGVVDVVGRLLDSVGDKPFPSGIVSAERVTDSFGYLLVTDAVNLPSSQCLSQEYVGRFFCPEAHREQGINETSS